MNRPNCGSRVSVVFAMCVVSWVGSRTTGQPGVDVSHPTGNSPQCGHHAILHCCQLLGVPVQMQSLLEQLPPRDQGHSILELVKTLERIGLKAEGRVGSIESLGQGTFPVIAHTSQNHFLAVERVGQDAVCLLDGYGRRQVWAIERFRKEWDGKMLRVTRPDPERPLPLCPDIGKATPRLAFDTLFIDHGLIQPNQDTIEYVFRFRNLGSADLTIDHVRTTCRCLQSAKPDRAIPPGQTSQITLLYSADERGSFLQKAYVHSNDPCQSVIQLSAAGNTDRRVVADPESIALGTIPFGQTRAALCTILGDNDVPVTILSATCDLPDSHVEHFELTPQRLQYLRSRGARILGKPINAHLLRLTVKAPADVPTTLQGTIEVVTDVKDFEQILIPVQAEVIPPLYLAPEVLYLGEVLDSDDIEQTVNIVARDRSSFTIRGVEVPELGVEFDFPPGPQAGQCGLRFSATGAAALRLADKTISIRVQSDNAPDEFALPLRVYARAQTGL